MDGELRDTTPVMRGCARGLENKTSSHANAAVEPHRLATSSHPPARPIPAPRFDARS